MNGKYDDIHKRLVEAYYSNKFEVTLKDILENDFEDPEEGKQVIAALCGVDVDKSKDNNDFIFKIVESITKRRVRAKIVQKVSSCSEDCGTGEDGRSKCMSVCPVDAIIRSDGSNDKWIDEDLCISCGRCVESCGSGNYLGTSDVLPVAEVFKEGEKVVAIVAPAIAGQFGEDVTLDMLREAFVKIGFIDMVEVAMAADVLSIKEAMEFNHHVPEKNDFMISSCCCPVWVGMLRKKYNDLIPDVSPSVSPMIAMARIIKSINKDIKVVFVGPCIAKKMEAKEPDLEGDVDYVLTFKELQEIFEVLNVDPSKCVGLPSVDYAATGGRLYARIGGVSEAVWDIIDHQYPDKRHIYTSIQANGVKECKQILNDLEEGKRRATFIEGMACPGGCVGGPRRIVDVEQGTIAVNEVAYDSAVKIPIHGEVITGVLKRLGVKDISDFKNHCEMFEREF